MRRHLGWMWNTLCFLVDVGGAWSAATSDVSWKWYLFGYLAICGACFEVLAIVQFHRMWQTRDKERLVQILLRDIEVKK